jgi:hypothetical protein
VEKSESLVGPSGLVGSGNVQAADPLTSQALAIARQLRAGEIASKQEAARLLVAEVLKEKLRLKSKVLTKRIADQLQDDPRLSQVLERLWAKG